RQGNYPVARRHYEEILMLAREGDDMRNIPRIPFRVEYSRDLPGRASENDDKLTIPFYVEGLAEVVAAQGEGTWAARLWGAAEAMREGLHAPLPSVFRTEYERAVVAARAQLGEHAFAAAWAEGRMMTPEQALTAEGKALLPTPMPARPASAPPMKSPT